MKKDSVQESRHYYWGSVFAVCSLDGVRWFLRFEWVKLWTWMERRLGWRSDSQAQSHSQSPRIYSGHSRSLPHYTVCLARMEATPQHFASSALQTGTPPSVP